MSVINQITSFDIKDFDGMPTLTNYQRIATKSAIYPGRASPLGLMYAALKLNGEAGELAEHVGKAMRDDGLVRLDTQDDITDVLFARLTPERRELILKEVGDCLWYLSAICNELETSLRAVATANLCKLADRSSRGALQGSGDER